MRINRFTVHRDSQRVHSVIGVPRTLNECLVRVEHLLSPIFILPPLTTSTTSAAAAAAITATTTTTLCD